MPTSAGQMPGRFIGVGEVTPQRGRLSCARSTRASSCFICQLKGASIVRLHDRPHVHGDDLAVANHDLAADDGGSDLLRSAEQNCRHRVMQSTGIANGMEIEREK